MDTQSHFQVRFRNILHVLFHYAKQIIKANRVSIIGPQLDFEEILDNLTTTFPVSHNFNNICKGVGKCNEGWRSKFGRAGTQLRRREGKSHGLYETLAMYIVGYSFSVMYIQYYKQTSFSHMSKLDHKESLIQMNKFGKRLSQ